MDLIKKYKLAVFCFMIGIISTLLSYFNLLIEQDQQAQNYLNKQAHQIEGSIRRSMTSHQHLLTWLISQWQYSGRPDSNLWYEQARQFSQKHNFSRRLSWYDKHDELILNYVDKLSTKHTIKPNLFITKNDNTELRPIYSQFNYDPKDKQHAVTLAIPMLTKDSHRNYIENEISLNKLIHDATLKVLDEDLQVKITAPSSPYKTSHLLAFYGTSNQTNTEQYQHKFDFLSEQWQVSIWPTQQKRSVLYNNFPLEVLITGCLISILVAFIVLGMTRSKLESLTLQKLNNKLQVEISEKEKIEKSLAHITDYDKLTHLFNRSALERFITKLLDNSSQYQMNLHCLLLIDLDRFKEVNDVLGHNNGDILIKKVAQRIKSLVPRTSYLARVGGDEFAVVFVNLHSHEEASDIAQSIIRAVDSRFVFDGYDLYLSASAGLAYTDQGVLDFIDLYRNADAALNKAKISGKNCLQYFSPKLHQDISERLIKLRKLRDAVAQEAFVLYYQPKVNIKTGQCIGVEALIRWFDDEDGLISPDNFIPAAEDTGLILQIGAWVLNEACRQLAYWKSIGFEDFTMAINISGKQILHPELIDQVVEAQTRHGVDAKDIELELTEQVFIENIETSKDFMSKVKEKGFSLSIDDFGVGYSSLSYLKHFPIDTLKIDRSFITHLPDDEDDVKLVQAIISLAKNMDLHIVAEGIEEIAQLNFLASHGCNIAQGYFFSKPLPPDELTKFLIKMHGHFKTNILE